MTKPTSNPKAHPTRDAINRFADAMGLDNFDVTWALYKTKHDIPSDSVYVDPEPAPEPGAPEPAPEPAAAAATEVPSKAKEQEEQSAADILNGMKEDNPTLKSRPKLSDDDDSDDDLEVRLGGGPCPHSGLFRGAKDDGLVNTDEEEGYDSDGHRKDKVECDSDGKPYEFESDAASHSDDASLDEEEERSEDEEPGASDKEFLIGDEDEVSVYSGSGKDSDEDDDDYGYDGEEDDEDDDAFMNSKHIVSSEKKGKSTTSRGSGKRPANAPPISASQQMDWFVRDKLKGIEGPMQTVMNMSVPVVKMSKQHNLPPGKAREQATWPNVIHGAFCFTEQKPNADGKNSDIFEDIPVMHMWSPSRYMSEELNKNIRPRSKNCRIVYHTSFEHYTTALRNKKTMEKEKSQSRGGVKSAQKDSRKAAKKEKINAIKTEAGAKLPTPPNGRNKERMKRALQKQQEALDQCNDKKPAAKKSKTP